MFPILPALCALALLAPDDAFETLTYEDAAARAQEEGRFLLVDFTAVWCAPCKQMDATTWVDEQVVAWIEEHAVAVKVDVDRHSDVADRYRIMAMPTIVLARDGREIDRLTGMQSAEQMLAWFDVLRRGRTVLEVKREQALAGDVDVDARYALAEELVARQEFDEASGHYLWLWQHGVEHQPGFYGVRRSFLADDIKDLARRHEPTREAFLALYREAEAAVRADMAASDAWEDWLTLARTLDQQHELLAWAREHRDADGVLRKAPVSVAQSLFGSFLRAGAYAEAGRLIEEIDVLAREKLERNRETSQRLASTDIPAMQRQLMEEAGERNLRESTVHYYTAALAADRTSQAAVIARDLLAELDDDLTREALVRSALDHARARPVHLRWVAEVLVKASPVDSIRLQGLLEEVEASLAEQDEG